jgi:hypothetical protein
MKRVFRFGVLVMVWGMVFGPSLSQAFNPGTHLYIADKVCPSCGPKSDFYYGAIAPDLALYVGDQAKWPTSFLDTHYLFMDLRTAARTSSQQAFAKGWLTHNEQWGADFYAHGHPPYLPGGYVVQKAKAIASAYGVDEELAHYLVEVAVDLLVKKNDDPKIGLKLLNAVLYRSWEDRNLLANVLVWQNQRTDWLTLTTAELAFRNLVGRYAMALSLPSPLDKGAIADLGVQLAKEMYGLEVSKETLLGWLNFAMTFCKDDYKAVIEGAIEGIRSKTNW